MPALVKDRQIIDDSWQLVETIADDVPANAIVPIDQLANTQANATWIEGDFELSEDCEQLITLDLVAVHFPAFADGRGLSLATLLRGRYGFKGELRAIGEVQPDLTPFMLRCGFDSFVLADVQAARTAIQCMDRMSDFYQGSAIKPAPAYRRRHSP